MYLTTSCSSIDW